MTILTYIYAKKRVKNVGSEKNILFGNENAVHWTKLRKPLGVSFDRTLTPLNVKSEQKIS